MTLSIFLYLHPSNGTFLFRTDQYVPVYGYSCYKNGKEFDNMHEAYLACSENTKCFGIVDGLCDMVGKFIHCLNGFESRRDNTAGMFILNDQCIYRKQEHSGNEKD